MKLNIKLLSLALLLFLAIGTTSCTESHASSTHTAAPTPENGAQFKEGKGLALTEIMAESIGLQTSEVTEENMTPVIVFELQTTQKGNEATGWLTSEQAASIRPGMTVEMRTAGPTPTSLKGKVGRLEKASFIASGDFEIAVQTETPVEAATPINATILLEAAEGRTAIPKSALLTTAEGSFVYARNADFYVRTPIKTGAVSDAHIEVLDGLYTGDEIVSSPVMSLWLAELQILRGGKACTCGH